MEKVENYDEFIKIWEVNHKNRYWGNKKITKEQEQNIIEKANIKDFKRYNIYMLNDGNYIVLDTKYTIYKDLYYDDEMDAPEITLEYFKSKNNMNIKYDKIKNTYYKPYFVKNFNKGKEVWVSKSERDYETDLNYYKNKDLFVRFMTDEEIKEYNNIVENINKDYDERLEKYFKKYRDKIYAIGYWVNR